MKFFVAAFLLFVTGMLVWVRYRPKHAFCKI